MRLLIDANVYRHPAAGAYVHVNDELAMWGPRIIAMRRYQYRFQRPSRRNIAKKEVHYIPSLAMHGRERGLEFFTYWLIDYEMWNMPPAVDWIGRSTLDLFKPEQLPRREPSYSGFICRPGVEFDFKAELRKFIAGVQDERFKEILDALGPDNSQDAFHVWTCEREGIDCIVAIDGPFQAALRQVRKKLSLRVDVSPPSEICRRFNISPVDPSWFEANDAFRNTRLVKLFDRQASLRDRIIFKLYRGCVGLSRRLGRPLDFVIPGYDDGIPRALEYRRR